MQGDDVHNVLEEHPAAKLLRLACIEEEDWKDAIERNRQKRPDWTIELFVRPKTAPEPTRHLRRGKLKKTYTVTVHTWRPDGTYEVEQLEVT